MQPIMTHAEAREKALSRNSLMRLETKNAEMRREMDANATVASLLRFIEKLKANKYNRHDVIGVLETCINDAETTDSDIRLHKFLSDALEYVKHG